MSVDAKGEPTFEGWAVVELMGHRRLGGYVREVVVAGQGMLRVEMPADDAGAALTQFYSPSALYCLTPSTEETARAALRLSRPEPVSKWDLDRVRDLQRPALAQGEVPLCAQCGAKPATCIGLYDAYEGQEQPACDDCCGHGNEDGHCRPIATSQADGHP